MLTVKDANAAIQFYGHAFAAVEESRFTTPTGQVVAELRIDGLRFFVVDENPEAFNVSPTALGGTTVRINLVVDDPDATTATALRAGRSKSSPWPTSPTACDKDASLIPKVTIG